MSRTPEQKARRKAYNALPHVKERLRELARLKYKMNPQKYCDRQKILRLTQPEKIQQYEKNKYEKHKEKILARVKKYAQENPEVRRKASAKFMSLNKDRYNAWGAKYRAVKKNAIPKWAELDAISEAYKEAEYHGLHVDHIIPLQSKYVCGLHVWDNLQLLTESKNKAKGNRQWPDMP